MLYILGIIALGIWIQSWDWSSDKKDPNFKDTRDGFQKAIDEDTHIESKEHTHSIEDFF